MRGAFAILSVHRSDIIRQHQRKHAVPSRGRTGQSSTSQHLYGSAIRKRQVIVGSAQRLGQGFQPLISADVFHAFGLGGQTRAAAEQDKEFRVTRLFRFPQFALPNSSLNLCWRWTEEYPA